MEELYRIMEEKILASGYKGDADAESVYNEICDLIEDKENGSYVLMSKKKDGSVFEYKVDVLEDSFNLSYIRITNEEEIFHINFDL